MTNKNPNSQAANQLAFFTGMSKELNSGFTGEKMPAASS